MTDWGSYTPGPWKVKRWGTNDDPWPTNRVSIGPADRAVVISPKYADTRFEADARLISKAYLIPRLEAALEQVASSARVGAFEGGVELGITHAAMGAVRDLLGELRSEP